jgi:hypothetical protein
MNTDSLDRAVYEAERFLKAALRLKDAEPNHEYRYGPSRESAALKRVSLELVGALADMWRRS